MDSFSWKVRKNFYKKLCLSSLDVTCLKYGIFGITASSFARFMLILNSAYVSFGVFLLTVQHIDKILKMELLLLHGNYSDV